MRPRADGIGPSERRQGCRATPGWSGAQVRSPRPRPQGWGEQIPRPGARGATTCMLSSRSPRWPSPTGGSWRVLLVEPSGSAGFRQTPHAGPGQETWPLHWPKPRQGTTAVSSWWAALCTWSRLAPAGSSGRPSWLVPEARPLRCHLSVMRSRSELKDWPGVSRAGLGQPGVCGAGPTSHARSGARAWPAAAAAGDPLPGGRGLSGAGAL